jgi:outer membrane protein assembly factor BamB
MNRTTRALLAPWVALLAVAAGCMGGSNASPPETVATTGPPPEHTTTTEAQRPGDWTRFGFDADRSNWAPQMDDITAENVGRLQWQRVELPGVVDSSPIYLRGVEVGGGRHDVFVVNTSYGKAVAIDADNGRVLWTYAPPGMETWEGSAQITQASPIADPDGRFVFSVSPDGRVHKLALVDGHEVRSRGWPAVVTEDPVHEKTGTALNLSGDLVLATTGGYFGDAPPYQGHVVAIDRESGRIVNVFNALCSDRHVVIDPTSCPESGSAIWARAGAVIEPETGNILVATGNGEFDGETHWGDSVLELSPDAGRILQNYTPENEEALDTGDVDLGSTAPAVLTRDFVVQGGKAGVLALLDLRRLNGTTQAGPRKGGELRIIGTPGGQGVFTTPAVWHVHGETRIVVTTYGGTASYVLRTDPEPRLEPVWANSAPGTSPIIAGKLLYVYDPTNGGLNVYLPRSGRRVARLPAGPGHWNSPVVADGRIALPEGNANEHGTSGLLDIYRLP